MTYYDCCYSYKYCIPQDYGLAATTPGNLKSDEIFFKVTSVVDAYTTLPGKAVKYVDELPAAIALDMYSVKIVDLTGLIRLDELIKNARSEC